MSKVGAVERCRANGNKSSRSLTLLSSHPAIVAIEGRKDVPPRSTRLGRALRITGVAITIVTVGLAVNMLQLLTAPLILINRPLSHRLNSIVTFFAWTLSQYWVEGQDNVHMTISGLEAIPEGESAFVIANHAFFADFFLIHALSGRRGMMAYCRYFLKDSIKYIPVFGWGMYLCNMPFLKRNWQRDSHRISRTLGIFIDYRLPVWLVSHVEGSRMSLEKKAKSHQYAQEHGLPILEHVLLPRCKGFTSTISELRGSHIQHVYDVTLAYHHRRRGFGATPSLWEIMTGALDEYQLHVHVERIPLKEIPVDEMQAGQWLYDTFVRKDALLAQIKDAFERKAKFM